MHPPQILTVTFNPAFDLKSECASLKIGALNRATAFRACPGGKGINVARALADYGHPVAATGFLGTDQSAAFEALFASRGITDKMLRLEGSTRTCVKLSDPITGETTEINSPGLCVREEAVAALKLKDTPSHHIAISGSVPPGLSPSVYAQLVKGLREAGRRVLLDTSGQPLAEALAAKPHMIKPNVEELAALIGRDLTGTAEIISAARSFIERGLELVVVSMAQKGACFVAKDCALVASAPCPQPVCTVGAGDAMVAGILSSEADKLDLQSLARRATAFSLFWISHPEEERLCKESIQELAASVKLQQH